MQDGSSTRDEEFAKNVNALLADPTSSLVWSSEGHTTSSGIASTSATAITVAGAAAPSVSHATPEQLTHLQSLVNSMTANNTSTNPPGWSEITILFKIWSQIRMCRFIIDRRSQPVKYRVTVHLTSRVDPSYISTPSTGSTCKPFCWGSFTDYQ